MIIFCEAVVQDKRQQENLIDCIHILGGKPEICNDKIWIDHQGTKEECERLISLFEHYSRHNITIIG